MSAADRQVFGSSLRQPWALVQFGSNQPNGRRPGTSVAYLSDDEGEHYLGGFVEFFRGRNEPTACWHFRYSRARRIAMSDVFHIFASTNKSKWGGPTQRDVKSAKKDVPVTVAEYDPHAARERTEAAA